MYDEEDRGVCQFIYDFLEASLNRELIFEYLSKNQIFSALLKSKTYNEFNTLVVLKTIIEVIFYIDANIYIGF